MIDQENEHELAERYQDSLKLAEKMDKEREVTATPKKLSTRDKIAAGIIGGTSIVGGITIGSHAANKATQLIHDANRKKVYQNTETESLPPILNEGQSIENTQYHVDDGKAHSQLHGNANESKTTQLAEPPKGQVQDPDINKGTGQELER